MEISVGQGRILSSTYQWEIDDYNSYRSLKTGQYIFSPEFNLYDQLWRLKLYPNGENARSQDNISLFLILKGKLQSDDTNIRMKLSLSLIIDDRQNKIIKTHIFKNFDTFSNTIKGLGKANFMNKSLVINDSCNEVPDKITIICEMIIKEEKSYKTFFLINPDSHQDHFGKLKNQLNNPKFSDIKFKVENKTIHAHKMILAANSEVFAAMFEHDMQEKKKNIVTIKDISYEVFNELLIFAYSGECKVTEEDLLSRLFESADKYQMLKLKDTCEQELCNKLSVDNVIALLQLADMHCAERLKKKAIDFIILHGNEIIDRQEFQTIRELNNKLFEDVFREIFRRLPKTK